ncbi:MAG: hypothetical protein GXP35_01810 [Actinobacteria bacterium]|nr:hypothetical protein [Actinomycetota bacterium]
MANNADGPAALAADLDFSREGFSCGDFGGHTNRPCIAQTASHGPSSLRFDVENVGNIPTGGVVAYSLLPHVGDTYALTGDPRGSDYRPTVTGEAVLLARPAQAAVTIAYSIADNPCTPELSGAPAGAAVPTGCDNGWSAAPADLSTVTAIRIVADIPSGQVWAAGETLSVTLPIKAAQGSFERDEFAWMPFAYVLHSAAGTPFAPVETVAAGLRINQSQNGLGDWIWLDANRDGVQDAGEVGQNGVKIELYDANRDLIAATVSQNLNNDSARPGYYWFGDLEPGQYFIRLVEVPISWNTMTPDIGSDDTDSDINPLTLEGPLVSIVIGEFDRSVDVGFFIPQGPAECEDNRAVFDPTDVDVGRRGVNDFTPCPN